MRLVSWNLHGSAEPDLDLVADLLRSLAPDVIAFQEIRRHQARRLANLLGWPPGAWTFKHNGWVLLPRRSEGLATLSQHPLTKHQRITLSRGEGWWSYRRRIGQRSVVGGLAVVNIHLATHDDEVGRAAQVERLLPFAQGATVVAGDFNDVPNGPVLARLRDAGWLDPFDTADQRVGIAETSPAHAPVRRIDHVLIELGRPVKRSQIPDPGRDGRWPSVSDHLPVVIDLGAVPILR